jgi:hypothetical protein
MKHKDFLFLRQGVRSPILGVRSFPSPHNSDCHWGANSVGLFSFQYLSLAKTTSATKNGAILGRAGVNTISIASTGHRDFGGQGPVRACRAHTYILRTGGKLIRIRQLDRNDAGGLPIAPEKGPNLRLPNEFCRSAFPSRVRDACGPHGSSEYTQRADVSGGVRQLQ